MTLIVGGGAKLLPRRRQTFAISSGDVTKLHVRPSMSERSEEFRKHARDVTRNIFAHDDKQARELSVGLAQACIALARNEEWLEGEIPPVERPEKT